MYRIIFFTLTLLLYHLTLYFGMGYGMYYLSNIVIGIIKFFFFFILILYFGTDYSMLWYVFNAFYFLSLYGLLVCGLYKWGVSRQLPQRAAREPQIVLFLTHVYNTKMYLQKLFDKRFRRIFSSAFQWCKQFFRNFPFSHSKSTKSVISQKVYF